MWELMSGVANSVRDRVMPKRRSGMGTMTAVLIGASVGIAAWEAVRKSQVASRLTPDATATKLAQEVMDQLET
jgi:hypothetical protein